MFYLLSNFFKQNFAMKNSSHSKRLVETIQLYPNNFAILQFSYDDSASYRLKKTVEKCQFTGIVMTSLNVSFLEPDLISVYQTGKH